MRCNNTESAFPSPRATSTSKTTGDGGDPPSPPPEERKAHIPCQHRGPQHRHHDDRCTFPQSDNTVPAKTCGTGKIAGDGGKPSSSSFWSAAPRPASQATKCSAEAANQQRRRTQSLIDNACCKCIIPFNAQTHRRDKTMSMWALYDTQGQLENNPGSSVAETGSAGSKTGAGASEDAAFVAGLPRFFLGSVHTLSSCLTPGHLPLEMRPL